MTSIIGYLLFNAELNLSEKQAEAILDMHLRRLTMLEVFAS